VVLVLVSLSFTNMNDIDWWNTIIKGNILGNNNILFYVTYHLFGGVSLFNVFCGESC